MCEKPKRMEAVHQPTRSLLQARESRFCSSPRKRSSSGHAVKKRTPMKTNGSSLTPPSMKFDEVHAQSQRNGDAGENNETRQDEEAPMVAPADRIADAGDAAKKQECRERDADAQ